MDVVDGMDENGLTRTGSEAAYVDLMTREDVAPLGLGIFSGRNYKHAAPMALRNAIYFDSGYCFEYAGCGDRRSGFAAWMELYLGRCPRLVYRAPLALGLGISL